MKRSLLALALLVSCTVFVSAAPTLEIYFIDVEGGQATLMITPAGQSLLIDAGYGPRGPARDAPPIFGPGGLGRDAGRILTVIREAGLRRLDYLLITHFHPDHVGGVPEVASAIPIGTFIDYGMPLGFDRMTAGGFRAYEPLRDARAHIEARPGARLPLDGIEAEIVSAGGTLLSKPMREGGETNHACTMLEAHAEDGTENFRSVGVMFRFGAFRFLNLGDLSGDTLTSLACPTDMLGRVSAYLVAHHGDYDSNVPALYAALRPQVAIMNNGATKGGSPDAFRTLHAQAGMDLWQLHTSRNPGSRNAPDEFVANVDEGLTSYTLKLIASDDGSFRVVNSRTGFAKTYPRN